jgi:hypothetical protein
MFLVLPDPDPLLRGADSAQDPDLLTDPYIFTFLRLMPAYNRLTVTVVTVLEPVTHVFGPPGSGSRGADPAQDPDLLTDPYIFKSISLT